ncbi:MAG: sigma-70 family RNA polymerase sigma factor [bacterium]|nr:sigma-70 family RNA polymerase sigma factor [bacterium]
MVELDSFESFYSGTRDDCFRALLVTVRDVDEAADLLDEAYTRAVARWVTVRSHPAPVAWVMRTALNLHRDRWRRRTLRSRLLPVAQSVPAPELPVDPLLIAALWSLPDRQRQVVALRVVLDLDTARTAEVLGITAGTVTTHLHRGLATLRKKLASHERIE